MAYSQADLDALDAEIAAIRTTKSTSFADQTTTFRDLDELLKLRAVMQSSISTAAGQTRTRLANTCKGV